MIGRIQIYSLGQIYIVCHAYLEMIIFVHVKDDNSKHMKMTIYELCHAWPLKLPFNGERQRELNDPKDSEWKQKLDMTKSYRLRRHEYDLDNDNDQSSVSPSASLLACGSIKQHTLSPELPPDHERSGERYQGVTTIL